MGWFVTKRFAFIIPQIFLVAIAVFLLLRALPIDPVSQRAGVVASDEGKAQVRAALGLDVSVGAQLASFLDDLIHGQFGTSWDTSEPIRDEIVQRFPVTIQLIVMAFILAITLGIIIGRMAAGRPGGRTDRTVLGYSLFAGAQPDFWWGLMFIFIFYSKAGWFPSPTGLYSPDVELPPDTTKFILLDSLIYGKWATFVDVLKHLALPVITLTFILTGPLVKMTRSSVLNVVSSDYILYAKAAGLPHKKVQRYMLRNSLAPVVTLAAVLFGFMLGGAVLIEQVFTLDGLGRYSLTRMLSTDFPAVQGAVVIMTAFALLIYLLMDIIYAAMDPRIRLTK